MTAESYRGKLGKKAHLEDWIKTIAPLTAGATEYNVTFEWSKEMGFPGAFTIANFHHSEFYLKTLTLEDVPGHGRVHFICNSWVYHAERYDKDRVFFANQVKKTYYAACQRDYSMTNHCQTAFHGSKTVTPQHTPTQITHTFRSIFMYSWSLPRTKKFLRIMQLLLQCFNVPK